MMVVVWWRRLIQPWPNPRDSPECSCSNISTDGLPVIRPSSSRSPHISIGIRFLAWVVQDRRLLFTKGSVRWIILMTDRERLRFRGIAWNMMVVLLSEESEKEKENRPATLLSPEKEEK